MAVLGTFRQPVKLKWLVKLRTLAKFLECSMHFVTSGSTSSTAWFVPLQNLASHVISYYIPKMWNDFGRNSEVITINLLISQFSFLRRRTTRRRTRKDNWLLWFVTAHKDIVFNSSWQSPICSVLFLFLILLAVLHLISFFMTDK